MSNFPHCLLLNTGFWNLYKGVLTLFNTLFESFRVFKYLLHNSEYFRLF